MGEEDISTAKQSNGNGNGNGKNHNGITTASTCKKVVMKTVTKTETYVGVEIDMEMQIPENLLNGNDLMKETDFVGALKYSLTTSLNTNSMKNAKSVALWHLATKKKISDDIVFIR